MQGCVNSNQGKFIASSALATSCVASDEHGCRYPARRWTLLVWEWVQVTSPAVDTAYNNWVSNYLKTDPTSNGSRKYVLKTPADQDIKTVSEGIG